MADMIHSPEQKHSTHWIALGFLGFLIAYVAAATALRGQFDVRYNDTTVVHSQLQETPEKTLARLNNDLTNWEAWKHLLVYGDDYMGVRGTDIRPDAYRPLQCAYGKFATLLYFRLGKTSAYLLCFLLLGLSGYLIFRLFQEVGSGQLAAISTAAYLFFPAIVSPAWNPLAGAQSVVPGAYAAALLAYLRYLRTERVGYLLVIAAICAVGPLFKETIGVAAFLLLTHYLFVAPVKRWAPAVGLAVACLHGLFPSTLVRLVLAQKLSLLSIFDCGALHDHAGARSWRPDFLMDLLALVPPSFLLVSLVCIVICTYVMKPTMRLTLPERLMRYVVPLARGALLLLAGVAIVAMVALIAGRPIARLEKAAFSAFAAIALYGLLYVDVLIAGWFCAMFLPLLRIYFNTTQCGYLAAPLIYLSVASLFHAWSLLAARNVVSPLQTALKYSLVAVGIVAFCDNALSIPNSWIAYQETGKFNDELFPADLRQKIAEPNAPARWAFIENSVVVDDAVILASRFSFGRGTYNFDYGVPPSHVLKTDQEVQSVLSTRHCVLVIADHPSPRQGYFWDLRRLQKSFHEVGEQHVDFAAYYADPLRRLVDNRYRSMMAPPDFQHEFVKETRWFREEFTNCYHVLIREKGPVDMAGLGLFQR